MEFHHQTQYKTVRLIKIDNNKWILLYRSLIKLMPTNTVAIFYQLHFTIFLFSSNNTGLIR